MLDFSSIRELSLSEAIGVHGSQNKAADALGIPRSTFRRRLKKEQVSQGMREIRGRIKKEEPKKEAKQSTIKTVMVIGDFHRCPSMKNDIPKWLGMFANDIQPDAIVHIGDLGDFDSVARFIEKGSFDGKAQPSIDQDIESVAAGFRDFHQYYTAENEVILHTTLGNHDERLWIYENANPQSYETFTNKFTGMLEHYGWAWSRFGAYKNIFGVDFTHAPMHEGGRAISGKGAVQRIANESQRDVVFGHTHKFCVMSVAKLGHSGRVTAVNVGCTLPQGYIKPYAKLNANGWWWGVVLLTIIDGKIEGVQSKPMAELEKEYSCL